MIEIPDELTKKKNGKLKFLKRVINLSPKRLYYTTENFDDLLNKWLSHPVYKLFKDDKKYICIAIEIYGKVLILFNKYKLNLIKVDTIEITYEKINGLEYLDLIKICY